MLLARLEAREDKKECLLIVVEPANLEKLRMGQPIIKNLRQFIPEIPFECELVIGYTPDMPFVAARMRKDGDLLAALKHAADRPEVFVPVTASEEVVRTEVPRGDKAE
ncbi:MAG: hypothetical protein KGL39_57030 [Patescibacteria group bacterium]|nr:hypothetical protein [Patescibacteria group bacterium]